MKKLFLILAVFQLLAFSIAAQTPSGDKEKLKQLNLQVIANFKDGKIDDAFVLAKLAVEVSVKVSGDDNERASAYFNLGMLYRFKKKYAEAIENLQKALAIYQLNAAKNARSVAKTLHGLADVYALDGDKKKALENYELAFNTAETAYGKEGREILQFLEPMSDVYFYLKKYDEAQEIFERRFRIVSKNSPANSKELEKIEDDFTCFIVHNFEPEEAFKRRQRFRDAIKTEEERKAAASVKVVSGGVVNGRATYLAKPEYPASEKLRSVQGAVTIAVTIDENGNVTEARAICGGDKELQISAESAARKSKFKPVTINGQAVKVEGVIIYNFVARRY